MHLSRQLVPLPPGLFASRSWPYRAFAQTTREGLANTLTARAFDVQPFLAPVPPLDQREGVDDLDLRRARQEASTTGTTVEWRFAGVPPTDGSQAEIDPPPRTYLHAVVERPKLGLREDAGYEVLFGHFGHSLRCLHLVRTGHQEP